ncbi:MAG: antitoxin Xre/MbcA/ParS toxin-binding domain-containing protein [Ilumatobacteraceae bacterium]
MAQTAATPESFSEHDVRRGVPVTAVAAVADSLQVPVATVLEWLSISPRTWARRKQQGMLDVLESDRVARLHRLVRRAAAVLGGAAEGRTWLTTPQRALQRRTPLAVASTEVGAEAVFQLLGRIEYGVFS